MAVSMTTPTGTKMDGFVEYGCGVIAAGVNAGYWYRAGHPPPKPSPAPPTPPAPPPSPTSPGDPDVTWDTPSDDVTGSMPLGNGRLGVNVWADSTGTVGLLLSHVDALDENGVGLIHSCIHPLLSPPSRLHMIFFSGCLNLLR
jgi:hypothetical protein